MMLFFSKLIHNEINLDEAKGGQQVLPQKSFTVLNDDFSDLFFKDFEVTSKHFYRSHIFLVWFRVFKLELELMCATPCLLVYL